MNLPTLNRCLLPFKQPLDQLGMKGTNRLCTRALNYQELIIRSTVPGGGAHPHRSPLVLLSLVGGRAGSCRMKRGWSLCVSVCVCAHIHVYACAPVNKSQCECCARTLFCAFLLCVHTQCWSVYARGLCVRDWGADFLLCEYSVHSLLLPAVCMHVPCVVCTIVWGLNVLCAQYE